VRPIRGSERIRDQRIPAFSGPRPGVVGTAGDVRPPCFYAPSTVWCLRSSRRIPLRVAPRPGEGSVAASSDEGFVMLVISMTKGCDGVSVRLVAVCA
jgi:hypothetical protein